MSKELKPCPFCQSRAEHYSFNYRIHTVRCSYCLADCGEHDTPERAAFVWNTRPAENALQAENERLKRELSIADDATKLTFLNLQRKNTELKETLEKVKNHLTIHRDHSIQSCRQDGKTFQAMNEFMARFCNGLLELINTDMEKGEKINE